MADLVTHRTLAEQLLVAARRATLDKEWPIIVDAGFYAVFHLMEALNAVDCIDSYNFADADDLLSHTLTANLGESFARDYRYLFYFRRGVLYGWHFPSESQVRNYLRLCESRYTHVLAALERRLHSETPEGAIYAR
jgi:hypothetical protein